MHVDTEFAALVEARTPATPLLPCGLTPMPGGMPWIKSVVGLWSAMLAVAQSQGVAFNDAYLMLMPKLCEMLPPLEAVVACWLTTPNYLGLCARIAALNVDARRAHSAPAAVAIRHLGYSSGLITPNRPTAAQREAERARAVRARFGR